MIFFFVLARARVRRADRRVFHSRRSDWMYNAHIYIVPVIVFYGAMALPFPLMLALAFFAGFLLDALTVQVIGAHVEISLRMVNTALRCAGRDHAWFRPLFARGRWEVHCVLSGICTSLILLAPISDDYLSPRLHLFFTRSLVADRRARVARHDMAPLVFWCLALAGTSDCVIRIFLRRGASMNRRRIKSASCASSFSGSSCCSAWERWLKLWWVQVAHGAEWTARIRGSSEATVRIPSVRGEIRDRNGVTLVQNRASYEVDFYLPEMVKGYRQRYGQPPVTEYRGDHQRDAEGPEGARHRQDRERWDRSATRRSGSGARLQRQPAAETLPRRIPRFRSPTSKTSTSRRWRSFPSTMSGCRAWISRSNRCAPTSTARSPRILLGYVGAPDDINKEDAKKFTFYQGDVEGKSNIEKIMDEYLRGKPGVRYLRRNAKGTIDGVLREDPPQQGANVFLTIDARIQAIAEEALRAVGRGAAQ